MIIIINFYILMKPTSELQQIITIRLNHRWGQATINIGIEGQTNYSWFCVWNMCSFRWFYSDELIPICGCTYRESKCASIEISFRETDNLRVLEISDKCSSVTKSDGCWTEQAWYVVANMSLTSYTTGNQSNCLRRVIIVRNRGP